MIVKFSGEKYSKGVQALAIKKGARCPLTGRPDDLSSSAFNNNIQIFRNQVVNLSIALGDIGSSACISKKRMTRGTNSARGISIVFIFIPQSLGRVGEILIRRNPTKRLQFQSNRPNVQFLLSHADKISLPACLISEWDMLVFPT